MRYPKIVYAIYPLNEYGETTSVYIGSTYRLERRIAIHLNNKQPSDSQKELHEKMRAFGYVYQILCYINSFADRHLEYDWIKWFREQTNMKVYNKLLGRSYL